MNKLDVLDRHYNSFILLDNPKDFFTLLADYIDLIDLVPEFEQITKDIQAPKKLLQDKLDLIEKVALNKITEIYKKLITYVSKNKIKSAGIEEAKKEYDNWLKGRTAGSSTLPDALHDQIREIVKQLYAMPEHKEFAVQYIEFMNQEGVEVKRYVPLKEYDEFREIYEDTKRQVASTLWGHLDEISWLYDAIRHGREKHKALVEEYKKKRSSKTAYDIMNYSTLVGEWVAIEEEKERKPLFFDTQKVRVWMIRLHHRILSQSVIGTNQPAIKNLTTVENKEIPTSFQPKLTIEKANGHMQIFKQTKKHKIAGTETRRFRLIRCLFSTENSIDSQYTPVFQKYDRIFEAIKLPKDKKNAKLLSSATMKNEMLNIIKFTIKEIQGIKPLRDYLHFKWERDSLRMDISPPEGNSVAT